MEPTDDVTQFFQELGGRDREPLLAKARGWVRFELLESDHIDRWLIAIDRGAVAVSHSDGPAECTVRLDRALFGRVCRGEANIIAAAFRGAVVCIGDVELLIEVARLFPAFAPDRQPQRV